MCFSRVKVNYNYTLHIFCTFAQILDPREAVVSGILVQKEANLSDCWDEWCAANHVSENSSLTAHM